jgi:hypothetical protein
MAVAIIGGTITSTLLTLLVVPTFYDSIELARERALAKLHRRAQAGNAFGAGVVTVLEAVSTVLFLRWLYRLTRRLFGVRVAASSA